MRVALVLVPLLAVAAVAWLLLDEPVPAPETDPLVPGSAPERVGPGADTGETPLSMPVAPPAREVVERVAVLQDERELPRPVAGLRREPNDGTMVRVPFSRGGPTGEDVLDVVSAKVLIRVRSARDLDRLEGVPIPEGWGREPVPLEQVLDLWREAGFEVHDLGHVILISYR